MQNTSYLNILHQKSIRFRSAEQAEKQGAMSGERKMSLTGIRKIITLYLHL